MKHQFRIRQPVVLVSTVLKEPHPIQRSSSLEPITLNPLATLLLFNLLQRYYCSVHSQLHFEPT